MIIQYIFCQNDLKLLQFLMIDDLMSVVLFPKLLIPLKTLHGHDQSVLKATLRPSSHH